jgi:hypothetical protein
VVSGRAVGVRLHRFGRSRSRSRSSIAVPVDAEHLITGGYWSTYWYNGHIYGSEIARGMDIFRLLPSEHLSQNEIDAASQIRMTEFNAQEQPRIEWPATSQVARAYLDQLRRTQAVPAARARPCNAALDRSISCAPAARRTRRRC